jgi:pyruvate-formate lyase-activating enzyme
MIDFRPFVPALAAEVRVSLTGLLGLSPDEVVSIALERTGDPRAWVAALTLQRAGKQLTVDLFDAKGPRQAWTRSPHFALAYRTTASDPFADPELAAWLNALKKRLTETDRTGAPESDAARAALDDYLPFSALADDSFRLVFGSGAQKTIALWLGFLCNQDCFTCWQSRRWPEPPRDYFRTWLAQGIEAGAKCAILSGGEPTLQPALPELIVQASTAGLHTVLETNAIRLSDDSYRRQLVNAGLKELFVSLHSPDARTSDTLTQTPGSFEKTIAGVRACLSDGLPVSLQCVVERMTAPQLAAHARFVVDAFVTPERAAGRTGVKSVTYSSPTRYLDAARYGSALAPLDELRPQLSAAVRTLRQSGVEAKFVGMSGLPLCALDSPREEAARLGPATEQDRQSKSYAAPCEECAVRRFCPGVPDAYLAQHGERGLLPMRSA